MAVCGQCFQMLGTGQGCEIKIQFSSKPGEGFLTLLASNNFAHRAGLFRYPSKWKNLEMKFMNNYRRIFRTCVLVLALILTALRHPNCNLRSDWDYTHPIAH